MAPKAGKQPEEIPSYVPYITTRSFPFPISSVIQLPDLCLRSVYTTIDGVSMIPPPFSMGHFRNFLLLFGVAVICVGNIPLPLLLVAVLVAILFSDADLTLTLATKMGKQPGELRGRVVWITGASSGIGEKLAYELAKAGAKLVLSARRKQELERVKAKCEDLSPPDFRDAHFVVTLDLREFDSHSKSVQEVLDKYGKIDYLVNNAGRSQRAVAVDTSVEVDQAVLDLNVVGTLSLTKAVLPEMLKRGSGMVVVISSVAGKMGAPASAAYSASKHALQGYFDTLRMEVSGSGVNILTVCPGPVVSEVSSNAFAEHLNREQPSHASSEDRMEANKGRMTGERCGYLIAVAMANQLHEVWISRNPILLFTYAAQYMPATTKWVGQWIGPKRLKAYRAGDTNINSGLLSFSS